MAFIERPKLQTRGRVVIRASRVRPYKKIILQDFANLKFKGCEQKLEYLEESKEIKTVTFFPVNHYNCKQFFNKRGRVCLQNELNRNFLILPYR